MAQVRFLAEDNSRLLDALTSTEHEAKVASSKAKIGMRTAKEVRVRQSPTVGTHMHITRVQLNTDRERILKENVQLRAMLQEVQRSLASLQDKVEATVHKTKHMTTPATSAPGLDSPGDICTGVHMTRSRMSSA